MRPITPCIPRGDEQDPTMTPFELECSVARHGHTVKELSECDLANSADNRAALRRELQATLAVLDQLDRA